MNSLGPLAALLRVAIDQTEADGGDATALKKFEEWHLEAERRGEAHRRHLLNNESVVRHLNLVGSNPGGDAAWVAGLDAGHHSGVATVTLDAAGDYQIHAQGEVRTFETPLEVAEFFRGFRGGIATRKEQAALLARRA